MSSSMSSEPLLGVGEDEFRSRNKFWRQPKFKIGALTVTMLIIIVVSVILFVELYKSKDDLPVANLSKSIAIAPLMGHLGNLYNISQMFNGSRTALTGYNASVDYVVKQLKENTNYAIEIQNFQVDYYVALQPSQLTQNNPTPRSFVFEIDFGNIRYSGSGNVTGTMAFVGGGCSATEYSGTTFVAGSVAVMFRNNLTDCPMTQKFAVAIAQNASALIMINDADKPGLFGKGLLTMQPIIGFALTYQQGLGFLEEIELGAVEVSLFANSASPRVWTSNIIADTPSGNPNNIVVSGAHLDSVIQGPGMNDDGSGSCVNLELAIKVSQLKIPLQNKIRFIWFAVEEIGLIGSTYYVNSLNTSEQAKIAAMLDFDMLASPNYVYGVYNGSSENVASGTIQKLFQAFYNKSGLNSELRAFDGRSDYGPFINVSIPAGGIFTGAEVIKTPEERKLFGGIANAAFDTCYHLACDDLDNINQEALLVEAQCAATILEQLALSPDIKKFLNGTSTQ